MRTSLAWIALVSSLALPSVAAAQQPDKAGCKDHPLFPTRMKGYHIAACETKDFDAFAFETGKPREPRVVEGRTTKITYRIEDRTQEPSGLAIVRNYENAVKSVQGTVAASDPNRWMNGKVVQDGKEIWVQAMRGNGQIWLTIVEKQGMTQEIVADAAAFSKGIEAEGHVAIEGIYFDTGKAEVKPESKPALDEITKLLTANPSLKLLVVGHTDSVGQFDANMKLSQARAEAVVQALVKDHGVAAARLKAQGAGPIAPVASNRTEDGRARNRRVELVEQ